MIHYLNKLRIAKQIELIGCGFLTAGLVALLISGEPNPLLILGLVLFSRRASPPARRDRKGRSK